MGLCSKQASGDSRFDWAQTTEIMPKPPCTRRQQPSELALKCPRCGSTNTKFCYYNNYNRSQPRHFCKSCKRHWTKGGTLRNVPIGGSRKNKRPKIPSTSTSVNPATTMVPGRKYGSSNLASSDNQKSMANILFQALIGSNGRNGTNVKSEDSTAGLSVAQKPSADHFEFSSGLSTAFEMNASLIPGCYQSVVSSYDCCHGGTFVDSMEESTITSVDINASCSSSTVPWPSPDTSCSALDFPDCWSWNDIEALTSADLNVAWDDGGEDGKIKP